MSIKVGAFKRHEKYHISDEGTKVKPSDAISHNKMLSCHRCHNWFITVAIHSDICPICRATIILSKMNKRFIQPLPNMTTEEIINFNSTRPLIDKLRILNLKFPKWREYKHE